MKRRTGRVVQKKQSISRKRNNQKGKVFRTVYKTGKEAARGMSMVAIVSLFFLMFASVFLAYQWKEFKIRQTLEQISTLKYEMARLRTEIVRKEGYIKQQLANYNRISAIASQKMGLQQSVESPQILIVDRQKWQNFLRKDAAQKN